MSFKLKTILGIGVIEILLLSILVVSSMSYLTASNEQQLIDRAHTSARLFATMTADAVVATDLATLDALVSKAISNPDLRYIRVRHSSGVVLSQEGQARDLARAFAADADVSAAMTDQSFDVAHDIDIEGTVFGRIELGLDVGRLQSLLGEAWRHMLGVAAIEVVLVGIFGFMLGRVLTRQLESLRFGARRVAEGGFGVTIDVHGRDELAETAASFNKMSAALAVYSRDLEQARDQAEQKRDRAESVLQEAMDSLSQGVLIVDEHNRIAQVNDAFITLHDVDATALDDRTRRDALYTGIDGDILKRPDGRALIHTRRRLSSGGEVWSDTDITSIMAAEARNRKLERDLMQSQKLESLGTLAGGIAHEINSPLQAITGNLQFASEAVTDMLVLLNGLGTDQKQALEKIDFAFLSEELPAALTQSGASVRQVSDIVSAMKEFARPGPRDPAPVNLNEAVSRTLTVCRNSWQGVAELDLVLADDLPDLVAVSADINQLILSVVANAVDAIKAKGPDSGQIRVRTKAVSGGLQLVVEDTGIGMDEAVRTRIFEPFFTTKEVGRGMGQGLAVAYDTVVGKQGGSITVDSTPGIGSRFTILLPGVSNQGSGITTAARPVADPGPPVSS